MSFLDLLLLVLSVHSSASPITTRDVPSFTFDGDAPYSVDPATLAAALTCPNGDPTSSAPGVLLVHGTGSTGQESWGQGYVPALQANGYTPCYVTLPGRAMGDMQISAEYVAYNLHALSALASNAPVSVLTHSQGAPDTQWALQFWPSTRAITNAFIALSPDFTGIDLLDSELSDICNGTDLCQASLWQQSAGSHFYSALHAQQFSAQVPTTAIWTQFDGVVNPAQANAELPSATTVSVQDLCPGRLTNHVTMTIDSAAFALALDALGHGGEASVARVRPGALTTCLRVQAQHMDLSVATSLEDLFNDLVDGLILGSPRLPAEPPLMPYAEAVVEPA